MLRKIEMPSNNVETSVEFVLRGAKKRRSMAMAAARSLTNEQGIQTLLVAVKQKAQSVLALQRQRQAGQHYDSDVSNL